jgi:transcriptional regulator with XRE-family HTH domain
MTRRPERAARARGAGPEDLGVAVGFLRSLRGWSQTELARAAGMDKSQISLYEQGRKVPSSRSLERLVAAVGLPFPVFESVVPFIRRVRAAAAERPEPAAPAAPAAFPAAADDASDVVRAVCEAVQIAAAEAFAELPLAGGRSGADGAPAGPPAAEDRQRAEELWARLGSRSARERRLLVEGARGFQSWALCERLCAESERAAAAPEQALELADLALRVASLAAGEESWRSRLQGYAWAHLGHARRAAHDLAGAAQAFARARALWQAGRPSDPPRLDERRLRELEDSPRTA